MDKDILQNNFETVYKEYKDYKSYMDSITGEVNAQREAFKEKATSGKYSDDTLVSALFDISIKPIQHETDLKILRDRLIAYFDAYRDVLEFPEEVKEEIKNLTRPIQIYNVANGQLIELNKELNDNIREDARRKHAEYVNSFRTTITTNTIPSDK